MTLDEMLQMIFAKPDARTIDEVATHQVWYATPCDCDAHDDHDHGQEIRG